MFCDQNVPRRIEKERPNRIHRKVAQRWT